MNCVDKAKELRAMLDGAAQRGTEGEYAFEAGFNRAIAQQAIIALEQARPEWWEESDRCWLRQLDEARLPTLATRLRETWGPCCNDGRHDE